MKYLFYFITIILLLAVNIGLFDSLQIRGQIPSLLLLLTLIFSLEKESLDFFFIAMISGLFLDFFSSSFFGTFTLGYLCAALVTHILAGNFIFLGINFKALSGLLLGFLAIADVVMWLFGLAVFKAGWTVSYSSLKLYLSSFPVSFFYNLLLLYPMYLFSGWLKTQIENFTIRRRGIVR